MRLPIPETTIDGEPVTATGTIQFGGQIGRVEIRNGYGGSMIASPDFSAQFPGTMSFTDAQGNVWNINGDASVVAL